MARLPDIPIARWASYQLDEFKRRTQRELDKLKFETDAPTAPSDAAWVSPNLEPTEPAASFKPLLERPEPSPNNPLQHGADAASKFLSATGDTLGALGSQIGERAKGPWDAIVTGGASIDLDRAAARRASLQQELTPENIQAGIGRNLSQFGTDLTQAATNTGLQENVSKAIEADRAYRNAPSLGGFGEALDTARNAGGSVLQTAVPGAVAGLEVGARGLGMDREGPHGGTNPLDPSLNLPVLSGAGQMMGVEPGAKIGVSDILGNFGPGKLINAINWASVVGTGLKNPLDPAVLAAGLLTGGARALSYRNAARTGGGGTSALVPEMVARDLPVRGQGLEEAARRAVSRTPGANITPEGWLEMDLGRYQPGHVAGGEAPRGGVFYSPRDIAAAYKHGDALTDPDYLGYGGNERVGGKTLFKNPLIVQDDIRNAADSLFGSGEADRLRLEAEAWAKKNMTSTVDPMTGDRAWRYDPVSDSADLPTLLSKWGGNPDDADSIIRHLSFSPANTRLGIQENLIAAAARREGFDAIIDMRGPDRSFGEIFDLRESAQPSPHGDFQIHPEFQGPSDSPSRLNAYHISPKADLANVDPAYQGTGQMGAERARREARPEEWAPYSNWYTDSPASRVEAHRFGGKNLYKAQFEVTNKPGGLLEAGRMGDRSYAEVKAEGYSGISYPERGQVHMFDVVEPEHVGPAPRASEFGRKPVIPGDQYFGQTRPEPTHAPLTPLTPDRASHITEETSIAGGGTWQPRNGYAGLAEGEPGFIVGSPPDVNGNRIPGATIETPEELARFVEANKQHLDANPDYMIGTWKPAGRPTTVDVVQKFGTLEEALAAGKARGEEAIWDNGSGKEVPATGEPQKAGDLLDLRESKDPATVKAQQLMDWYDARAQEQIPDMKARAVSVAVKNHHLPQALAEQVYDSAVRQVKDSKIIATGYGEPQIRALLQEGKFTNKFTAAKSPEELAQMTIDTVGRSRIQKKGGDALAHAADFVDREQASIRLAVGEDTTDFVYAFATAGPPMPGTRVPWFYTVWDEAQPRVTSIHHPFGLLSPKYTFHHTSMDKSMREALWTDDVVRGATREDTLSGPRRTGWEGEGTGKPGYTPWLSGPTAEDHMLASNAVVGMTHELADSAALGKLTDPDQIAAVALGTNKSQFQPMAPAFTGQGQGAVAAAGMSSAGEQVSKRAESLIIHPTLEGIKAIYIMGPKEMLGAKIPGLNMTRREAMLALREKIATETGKDVPVYINDFRDNPGKLITDAEVIAGSPIKGGLAPGRAGIQENYTKAGYPAMGLHGHKNPAPSTLPYLLKQAQLRAATGGATGGVAGYNADEDANPEERLRNTVLGALGGAAAGAASVPVGRRLITKLDAAGKIDPSLYATHPNEKTRMAALMRAAIAELPDDAVVNAPPMVRVLGKFAGKEIRELGDHFNSGLTAGQVRDEVAKLMDDQTYAQTLKEVMFDLVNASSTRLRRSQELRADIPTGTGPRRALSPIFKLNDVMGPSRDPTTPKDFSAQSVIDNLANELGIEAPDLRILPDKGINAYAQVDPYGGRSLLGVTQGTLNQLDPEELTAVLRHEMLHIAHRDTGMDIGLGLGQERSTDPRPSESEATQAGYEGGAARPFEGMEPPPRPIQPRYGPSGRTAGEVEGYASGAQRPFEGMEPPMKPMSPSGGGPGEAEATVRGVRLGQQESFGGDLQPDYPHDRLPGMLPGMDATEERITREAVQGGLQTEVPNLTEGVYKRDPEALKRISDVVPTEYQNQVGDVYDKLVQRKANPREMTKFWNELNKTVSDMAGQDLGIAGPKTGTLSDFIQEWTYNSMLSGPRTHLVNFLGNTSETAWNLAGDAARYGPTSPTFKGELAGTAEGLRLGWADFLDVAKYGVSEGHAVAGDVPTITRYDNPVLQKLSDIIGPPTRALQGMDALFYRVNYGMIKGREAAKGAIRDGLQPGTPQFENRVRELMVDDAVSGLAHNEARSLTYKGRGGDLIKIPLAVQNMKLAGLPVGRLIVPFAETITNIAVRGVEKTPLGLVGVARDLRKGGVYDLAKTGAEDLPEHIRPADVRIRDGLMGTALMMSLIPVALGGNLTAQGPKNGKQREMLQAQGWKPYSIKVGDRWFQYANATGSMALPIGLLASAVEAAQQGEDPADTVAELVRRTFGLAQDMTWLQGLADFSQAGQQPGAAGMRYMTNWATRFLPYGGALNTLAQASDPTLREVDHTDLGQELASRIPVLRQDLPERTDVRGRSVDSTDFLLGALDPTRSSVDRPDTRLQLLSEYGVSIPDFQDTYRGRKLSATAQQRLQRASFTELSQGLPQLRGSAVWANATKAQRSDLLRSLVNLSRDRAADQILGPSTPAPSILPSGGLRSLVPPPTL